MMLVLVLALVGGAYWLVGRQSPHPPPAPAEPAPQMTDAHLAPPDKVADAGDQSPVTAGASRSPSPTDPGQVRTRLDPFIEHGTVAAVLEAAASQHGWSDYELRQNQLSWLHSCNQPETFRQLHHRRHEHQTIPINVLHGIDFLAFCDDFMESVGVELELQSLEVYERLLDGNVEPLDLSVRSIPELDRIAQLEGKNRVKELLTADLDRALSRIDQHSVVSSILFMNRHDLIKPAIEDERLDSSELNLAVVSYVADALICRDQLGDCRGADHPMVLLQCMRAIEWNSSFCYQPADIFDAIYQIHTPLEHMAFWSMFNQVSALLAAHRRG